MFLAFMNNIFLVVHSVSRVALAGCSSFLPLISLTAHQRKMQRKDFYKQVYIQVFYAKQLQCIKVGINSFNLIIHPPTTMNYTQ